MLFPPGNTAALQKHIDHYWVVKTPGRSLEKRQELLAFPGISPDLIIVLDGHYHSTYQGKRQKIERSFVYSFIHSKVVVDLSGMKSFVVVRFKPKGISTLLPFIDVKANALIQNPVVPASILFGSEIDALARYMSNLSEPEIATALNEYFQSLYNKKREGFIVDLAQELSPSFDLKEIRKQTKYSYSTLERYFKKDTGLSAKQFQSLRRCKKAVEEICRTHNNDWMHYVLEYGYFDQSHFIKELRHYTGFTPSQLLIVPSLVGYRPYL